MLPWAHTRAASALCGSALITLSRAAQPRQQDPAMQGPVMQNRNLCNSRYVPACLFCYVLCLYDDEDTSRGDRRHNMLTTLVTSFSGSSNALSQYMPSTYKYYSDGSLCLSRVLWACSVIDSAADTGAFTFSTTGTHALSWTPTPLYLPNLA